MTRLVCQVNYQPLVNFDTACDYCLRWTSLFSDTLTTHIPKLRIVVSIPPIQVTTTRFKWWLNYFPSHITFQKQIAKIKFVRNGNCVLELSKKSLQRIQANDIEPSMMCIAIKWHEHWETATALDHLHWAICKILPRFTQHTSPWVRSIQ